MRFLFVLCLWLILPLSLLFVRNGAVIEPLRALLASLGLGLCVYLLHGFSARTFNRSAWIISASVLSILLLLRFLLIFLYDFSGRGFTPEFISHSSWAALKIAWAQYWGQFLVLAVLIAAAVCTVYRYAKPTLASLAFKPYELLLTAFVLIGFNVKSLPESQFVQAQWNYHFSKVSNKLTPEEVDLATDRLSPFRAKAQLPVNKSDISASLPSKPLNLIMLYVESFNDVLTNNPEFPNLTPNLDRLKRKHTPFSQIHSSSMVTIEGIANSQCGTLFNMEYQNNSISNANGRLSELPCLGDVLSTAGYDQLYMGGAGSKFAGKGDFLLEHGFDEVRGWEYWRSKGFKRDTQWGLSDDKLFDLALLEIERKHSASRPFNLSLLTIGTHLPGFIFPGCSEYTVDAKQQYLNAVHCTDYLIGQFVHELESKGVLENTVMYIQADHGMFANTELQNLFGDLVYDNRLLSVLLLPPALSDKAKVGTDKWGSNLNTAATLLELLGIEHNVEFLLGESHYQQSVDYHLGRRQDRYKGRTVFNKAYDCDATKTDIQLPLDPCQKKQVLESIYALNNLYAASYANTNQICNKGLSIRSRKSGFLDIFWGNESWGERLYSQGRSKEPDQIRGLHVLFLDEHLNIRSSGFHEENHWYELRQFNEMAASARHANVILINNMDISNTDEKFQKELPHYLKEKGVYYGVIDKGNYTSKSFYKSIEGSIDLPLVECR